MSDNEYFNEPRSFRRRKNNVQAIRVTEDNAKAVARWCGGQALKIAKSNYVVNTDDPILKVPTLDEPLLAFNGEWVIRDEDGRFSLMENKEFVTEYEFFTQAELPQSHIPGARGVESEDRIKE